MSVLDRMNRQHREQTAKSSAQPAEASETASQSSTLAISEPPVIRRIRAVMFTLMNFIKTNDETGIGRFAFLLESLMDELIDEMADSNDLVMRTYMAQIGEVIAWIGHGNNERLPAHLRSFAEAVQPSANHPKNHVFVAKRDSAGESPSVGVVGDSDNRSFGPEAKQAS